jgi:hypothetical protein
MCGKRVGLENTCADGLHNPCGNWVTSTLRLKFLPSILYLRFQQSKRFTLQPLTTLYALKQTRGFIWRAATAVPCASEKAGAGRNSAARAWRCRFSRSIYASSLSLLCPLKAKPKVLFRAEDVDCRQVDCNWCCPQRVLRSCGAVRGVYFAHDGLVSHRIGRTIGHRLGFLRATKFLNQAPTPG